MSFTVAIVGRPNVGKSTLFNRLVGARRALVDDRPGVTRDRREGEGRLGDLSFSVIDTAGLEDAHGDSLTARMQAQTAAAMAQADVVLFLVDARAGTTRCRSRLCRSGAQIREAGDRRGKQKRRPRRRSRRSRSLCARIGRAGRDQRRTRRGLGRALRGAARGTSGKQRPRARPRKIAPALPKKSRSASRWSVGRTPANPR